MAWLGSLFLFGMVPVWGPGFVRKVRARAQLRQGPPLLQPWYDIYRAWIKTPIDGGFSGVFAEVAPAIAAVGALILWSVVVFEWMSLIVVPFLLVIPYLCMLAFAFETGSSFGGLGASRDMLLSLLAKPSLLAVLMLVEFGSLTGQTWLSVTICGVCWFALLFAILAEMAKPPFDDPRTHLELTMVHEAMLLEASGRSLSLFEIAAALKEASLLTLAVKVGLRLAAMVFPALEGLDINGWLIACASILFFGSSGFCVGEFS